MSPAPDTPFSILPLSPSLLSNLDSLGYHWMTPIQARSLPVILDRRDLIARQKLAAARPRPSASASCNASIRPGLRSRRW